MLNDLIQERVPSTQKQGSVSAIPASREMASQGRKDLVFDFARHIANTRYEDLPKLTVAVTKKSILDALGCTVAGSGLAEGGKEIVEIIQELGGKEECSVIGYGVKSSSFMAAFANGSFAHALDFDDVLDDGYVHPSISTVPVAFAMAERIGNVSGKDLITAVAIGNDIACRLALSYARRPEGYKAIWMNTMLHGVFSATAVCCKLMKMSESKIRHALGIAMEQAGGTRMIADGGSSLRGIYANFPSKTGVLSALMADKGLTTGDNVFEGQGGFFSSFLGSNYHRPSLTDGLGKKFEGTNVSFKPWASCRATHNYIEATLIILKEAGINKDSIAQIKMTLNEGEMQNCMPLDVRRSPKTVMDSKFSTPFNVAVAATYGEVRVENYTLEGLKDKAVLDMAKKVVLHLDNSLTAPNGMPPAIVEITTTSGKTYSRRVDIAYGHPDNPISHEDLVKKFKDCLAFSARPLSDQNTAKALSMLESLEDVADAGQIVSLLS